MKPKIIYNNKFLDFFGIGKGITLFFWIIIREEYRDVDFYKGKRFETIKNHEMIHFKQQLEMLVIPFFLWYGVEFILKVFSNKGFTKAYKSLSFEREAFGNEDDLEYLNNRKPYTWLKYIFKDN